MPNNIGMYLGLTGRSIGAADAYALGLLTHYIPASRFEEIKAALADTWPVDTVLDDMQVDPGPGELAPYASHIAYCFSAPSVEEIVARLGVVTAQAWAEAVIADLAALAGLVEGSNRAHSRCARVDLRQILAVDYRLACRFLDGQDFYEGVRAALMDKDGRPEVAAGTT